MFFLVDATGGLTANVQVANLPAAPDFHRAEYEVRWRAPFGFGYIGLHADRDAATDRAADVFYGHTTC